MAAKFNIANVLSYAAGGVISYEIARQLEKAAIKNGNEKLAKAASFAPLLIGGALMYFGKPNSWMQTVGGGAIAVGATSAYATMRAKGGDESSNGFSRVNLDGNDRLNQRLMDLAKEMEANQPTMEMAYADDYEDYDDGMSEAA